MARRRRQEIETVGMSFLDVISCGFGAVILLLVISMAFEPISAEQQTIDLRGQIAKAQAAREKVIAQASTLRAELASKEDDLARIRSQYEQLDAAWQSAQQQTQAARQRAETQKQIADRLETVRQKLTEEMKRLLNQPSPRPIPKNEVIGGIPVDSEYIIFVIDTSGSMTSYAWPLVQKKMKEVLDAYPHVKGLQVMNDMGVYMFPSYAGQWIPDTPGRRRAVLESLATWHSFSNSSPVEGIEAAIRSYYRADQKISLYVFGDDFSGKNINKVLETVAELNRKSADGEPRVRIHAFGFPTLFLSRMTGPNRIRFAQLMRTLAEQNAGTFVGLNGLQE